MICNMMGRHLNIGMSIVERIRRGTVMFSINWFILDVTGSSVPFLGGKGWFTHWALIESRIGSCSSGTMQ